MQVENTVVSTQPTSGGASRLGQTALLIGGGLLAIYLGLLALLYGVQEKLIFLPTPLSANHKFMVDGTSEVTVAVNGATLSALHFKQANAKGLVFFLHGNAGNLDTWFTSTKLYRDTGFDLFMIDYRGYGKSTGTIESEAQLHADVRAAFDHVVPRYAGRPVVLLGRSLGSGLAAHLAAQVQPALTVLVSPYSSMRDMARQQYPFVPAALLRYPLDSAAALAQVHTPVLLAHGENDALIPPAHSERLLRVTPRATLLRVKQAGHGDIHLFDEYLSGLAAALNKL